MKMVRTFKRQGISFSHDMYSNAPTINYEAFQTWTASSDLLAIGTSCFLTDTFYASAEELVKQTAKIFEEMEKVFVTEQ